MSDYSVFAQANPGTDYPTKDAALRAQLTLDTDKVDVAQPGYQFGERRNAHAGLDYAYYGGVIEVDGVTTTIANGTTTLANGVTNYVERTAAGVVSDNAAGFSADKIPMAEVVTAAGAITGVTDRRATGRAIFGMLSKSVAAGGTIVLTAAEARAPIIEFTGALPNNTTIEFPNVKRDWIIHNNTSVAFTLTCKVAAQTGVAVTQGKRLLVYGNGADIVKGHTDLSGESQFAAGTRMLFQQTSAPTGWTKETSATYNDAALRIVTGTAGTGGATAFTSVFVSGLSTGAFTLTTSEMPAHTHMERDSSGHDIHDGGAGASDWAIPQTGPTTLATTVLQTGSTGGGAAHAHTLNMGLKYTDVIIAAKD